MFALSEAAPICASFKRAPNPARKASANIDSMPRTRLAMIEPRLALGRLKTFLDRPTQAGDGGEFGIGNRAAD